jgi:S1-C subfamily serine protease
VIEFDGERVRSTRQFARLVQETPAGRSVRAVVIRDGSRQSLTVMPEASESSVNLVMPEIRRDLERGLRDLPRAFEDFDLPFGGPRVRLGVELSPLSDQLAEFFGVREGVLVSTVARGSAAAEAGVRAGDVITAVDGRMVESAADVRAAVADVDGGATLGLTVVRDGETLTLSVTLPDGAGPPGPAI